jgi:Flp pilus assembly protein TadG
MEPGVDVMVGGKRPVRAASSVRHLLKRGAAKLGRLGRHDSGTVVVIAGIIFPVVVGGMGLGTEAGYWYFTQRKVQHAADVSAYAAAVRMSQGDNSSEYKKVALHVAEETGFKASAGTIEVNSPPQAPSAYAGQSDHIQVVLTETVPRLFTSIFVNEPLSLSGRAVASVEYGSSGCVLALSRHAARAVQVSGSADIQLAGCDVASNSRASDAFNMQGSARLTTGCVHSAGGVSATQNLVLTDEINGEGPCKDGPRDYGRSVADPYGDVEQPTVTGTCGNFVVKGGPGNRWGDPGHYCNMNITQDMELKPGVYIVDGGRVAPNTTVTGTGVTIFLTNGANIRLNNNSTLQLSAPTEGDYAGILFFGDRDDTGVQHRVNGSSNSLLTGAIYLPAGDIQFAGNAGTGTACTQVIGNTVEFTGNSSVGSNCAGTGTRDMQFGQQIALVE